MLKPLYQQGTGQYVNSVIAALDVCRERGHHLPRIEAVRALRVTAGASTANGLELETVLARYAENVAKAAQIAPRLGRGLFVMTAHQAKGKEFAVVIIVNASARHFRDDEEGRRLFYVAITRASQRWVVIAPDQNSSPLMEHLGN